MVCNTVGTQNVRVHLPLQQGLRHFASCTACSRLPISASASSITTRIKTHFLQVVRLVRGHVRVHLPLQQGLRRGQIVRPRSLIFRASASSITTRIKTTPPPPINY